MKKFGFCGIIYVTSKASFFSVGMRKRDDQMADKLGGDEASRRLVKLEEREKTNARRLDRLEGLANEVHAQNENIARLIVQIEFTNKQLSLQEKRLTEIEKQPRARLNLIWGSVITALASAAVGAIATVIISLI